jgi:hypothetical protein
MIEKSEVAKLEKFKCQNKTGISLIAACLADIDPNEITNQSRKVSTNSLERKLSFHNYNPQAFDIWSDFKLLEVIYSERLGTAEIKLVEHISSGIVSTFNHFIIIESIIEIRQKVNRQTETVWRLHAVPRKTRVCNLGMHAARKHRKSFQLH